MEDFAEESICNYKYIGRVLKVRILEKLQNMTWYQIEYDEWNYEEWACGKDIKKGESTSKKKRKAMNEEGEEISQNIYSIGENVQVKWHGIFCDGKIANLKLNCPTYKVEYVEEDGEEEFILPIMFLKKIRPPPMPPIQISIEDMERNVRKRLTVNNLSNLSYSRFAEIISDRIGRKGEHRKIHIKTCGDNVIIEDEADIKEIRDKELFLVTFN